MQLASHLVLFAYRHVHAGYNNEHHTVLAHVQQCKPANPSLPPPPSGPPLLPASSALLFHHAVAAGESIIASANTGTADNDASLLLQARSCWWDVGGNSPHGSKHLVSRPHQERVSSTWAIPTLHSLPTLQIFELPSTASWRP